MPPPDRRQQLVRLIHVARGKLALDDAVYRVMLETTTGKTSCTEMTIPELETVLERMKRNGFRIQHKGSNRTLADFPQARKLRAIWLQLHQAGIVHDASEAALSSWVKAQSGVDTIQWLDSKLASQLIERLKKWQKRTS